VTIKALLAQGLSHGAVHKRSRAAVLTIGEGAALGFLSVAALWGTWRYRVPVHDVLVPRRHRPVEGIRVHSCRRLDPRDVTVYHGIPVTTVARMLVDLTDPIGARVPHPGDGDLSAPGVGG
jgi:hypothetical protein